MENSGWFTVFLIISALVGSYVGALAGKRNVYEQICYEALLLKHELPICKNFKEEYTGTK